MKNSNEDLPDFKNQANLHKMPASSQDNLCGVRKCMYMSIINGNVQSHTSCVVCCAMTLNTQCAGGPSLFGLHTFCVRT